MSSSYEVKSREASDKRLEEAINAPKQFAAEEEAKRRRDAKRESNEERRQRIIKLSQLFRCGVRKQIDGVMLTVTTKEVVHCCRQVAHEIQYANLWETLESLTVGAPNDPIQYCAVAIALEAAGSKSDEAIVDSFLNVFRSIRGNATNDECPYVAFEWVVGRLWPEYALTDHRVTVSDGGSDSFSKNEPKPERRPLTEPPVCISQFNPVDWIESPATAKLLGCKVSTLEKNRTAKYRRSPFEDKWGLLFQSDPNDRNSNAPILYHKPTVVEIAAKNKRKA